MNRDNLKEICRTVIYQTDMQELPDYCCGIDPLQFEPHEWVLESMEKAQNVYKKNAELYEHMLKLAHTNGFESLTQAIASAVQLKATVEILTRVEHLIDSADMYLQDHDDPQGKETVVPFNVFHGSFGALRRAWIALQKVRQQ